MRPAGYDPDGWFPQPLGTGHLLLAEKDLADDRPRRARSFPFGFGVPVVRNASVRNRHRGTVARRA